MSSAIKLGRSKSESCKDVFSGESWKVFYNFIDRHPCSQIAEYVPHRNPHATDAWLTRTLVRVESDYIWNQLCHISNITIIDRFVKIEINNYICII